MPSSVIAAVAASAIGEAVAGAIMYGTVMSSMAAWTFAYTAIEMGVGFIVSSGLRSALSGGSEKQSQTNSPAFTAQATQRTHIVRSAVANRQIIYGQVMVSGPLVFAASTADNNTLWLVVALAGHEVEEIGTVYLNDVSASDSKFSGYVTINKHLGSAGQVADADLVAANLGWTANHRLRGVAHLVVKLTYNRDVFPTGIPNIKAVVKGKKLYDPRTATTAYSTNWALAVRDYLASAIGLGCTAAELDDASFIAAANVADEGVATASGSEFRYTCNGVVDTGATPMDIINGLLSAGGGVLSWTGGVYRLFAGAYSSPVLTLTADDLRGPVQVRPRVPRRDLYNGIKGTYVDPAKYWQPGDFPPVSSATYASADGGVIFRDVAFPFTTSSATAQRLAQIMLQKSRQSISVSLPCKPKAFKAAVWDVVRLTLPQMGWSEKEFRVTSWALSEAGGVDLVLQEEAAASYAWSADLDHTADTAPDTNLPDPFNVGAPTGVVLSSGTSALIMGTDGSIISRIRIDWSLPTDVLVRTTEIQGKRSSDTDWQTMILVDGGVNGIFVGPVEDGVSYDIRLRFENSIGVRSSWTTVTDYTVVGKTQPPSDVPWFLINGDTLTWGGISDLDKAGYEIRWQAGNNRSWGDAVPLHDGLLVSSPYTLISRPYGAVTLLIKAVDTSGNESVNAAAIVTDLGDPVLANVIWTHDFHALGFPGTITGATWDSGTGDLVANADGVALMWSSPTAAMWTADGDPMWAAGSTYSAVTYLGTAASVTAAEAGGNLTLSTTIDGAPVVISYRRIGGAPMWTTDGSPMWSADSDPMWPSESFRPWPGSVVAELCDYEFKVEIGAGTTQGRIYSMVASIDVPDITESFGDVAISAGGTRLPITKTYRSITTVNLTLQADGGTARTVRVEDKNTLIGPLVKCYDSTGTPVSGTIDSILQGF